MEATIRTGSLVDWTIVDWKNIAWTDESRFLLQHSDGRVRIWRKEHGSILPCLNGSDWWRCNGVGDIFLAHFGPLSTNWASFKHHSLPEYCCSMSIPLWLQCTNILMATSSRIMHHVTKLKSSQTGFLNMTMSSLCSNGLHSHQIWILWDVVEQEIHIMNVQLSNLLQLCDDIMSMWTKINAKCFQYRGSNPVLARCTQ